MSHEVSKPEVSAPKVRPWLELQSLIPSLSQSERSGLTRSIQSAGVIHPVLVLPDGRIIDGHHRWELSGENAHIKMLEIPEDDAFALGLALNRHRRHLTPEQQKQILEDLHQDKERLKRLCLALCEKMPQDRVSFELAVPQQTISDWLNGDINNTGIGKASKPDWRVKLSPENKLLLIKKALAGENQKVLADEYKISQQRVTLRSKLGKSRYRRQPTSPSLKNTSVLILSKVHGLLHPLDLLGRRNLTPSQKAALAVELEKQ